MKYNWRADHHENRKVWRIHAETAPWTPCGDLTVTELAQVEARYTRLTAIEARFYPILEQASRIDRTGRRHRRLDAGVQP